MKKKILTVTFAIAGVALIAFMIYLFIFGEKLTQESFTAFFNQFGVLSIFVMILLEYACFPIPSELVLPISGMLTAQAGIHFLLVLFLSVIAGILGSLLCYSLGRFFGTPILDWLANRSDKSKTAITKTKNWFDKYGAISVMIGRVIPLFRTYISFVAGSSKMKPLKFVGYTAIGVTAWNALLIGLGYLLGNTLDMNWLLSTLESYKIVVVIALVIVAILFVIKFFVRKK